MPHLTIRYSKNLKNIDFKAYLAKAHQFLADTLPTKIESCRSLVLKSEDYLIGRQDLNIAFIHIEVMIKHGRELTLVQKIGHQLVELLNHEISLFKSSLKIKTSIEIKEVSTHYFS